MTLQSLGRHTEALDSFARAQALRPELDYLSGMVAHARLMVCDWRQAAQEATSLAPRIARGERAAMPFQVVALLDSPALHRQAAETYVRAACPADPALAAIAPRPPGGKLRIGYFSADFHNHATAYLMAELLERHDRDSFELTAFSFGPDASNEMRQRLAAACDRFIDVRHQADRDVAALARDLQIDIAVDLKGFTKDFRAGIFAARAAPIQVNYLGYPGTMGAPYIDYLIADPVLIPAPQHRDYTEKIVWLPDSYQPNDRRREIAERTPTRAEAGLPPHGLVFCCFNNSYKITSEVFAAWLRILRQVADSVLWLLHDSDAAVTNLQAEAARQGIDPARLVFARRLPLPEHLARHRLADLFLDTTPYNAHTTASDALWAGLPVLTRIGASFAARVAASLLLAVGLPDLVTTSLAEYEAKAVALASDPATLMALRQLVTQSKLTAPLFDTAKYTRNLEAAYRAMQARHQAGLPPDHIRVPPGPLPPDPALQAQLLDGAARHRQGDLPGAARIYDDILRRQPNHFDALHLRGVAALQSGQSEDGIAWLRHAIALNPHLAEAHTNLGNGLRSLGHYEAALASFDRALALRPDDDAARRNRDIMLRQLGRTNAEGSEVQ